MLRPRLTRCRSSSTLKNRVDATIKDNSGKTDTDTSTADETNQNAESSSKTDTNGAIDDHGTAVIDGKTLVKPTRENKKMTDVHATVVRTRSNAQLKELSNPDSDGSTLPQLGDANYERMTMFGVLTTAMLALFRLVGVDCKHTNW